MLLLNNKLSGCTTEGLYSVFLFCRRFLLVRKCTLNQRDNLLKKTIKSWINIKWDLGEQLSSLSRVMQLRFNCNVIVYTLGGDNILPGSHMNSSN